MLDNATGLVWQQTVSAGTYNWSASAAAGSGQAYCNALSLNGLVSGWRMPTNRELFGIVDRTVLKPAIDSTVLPSGSGSYTWSSSQWVSGGSLSWIVSFWDGYFNVASQGNGYSVRCVH